jgi:glycosyltransferase involved in cell wall biosynthesis
MSRGPASASDVALIASGTARQAAGGKNAALFVMRSEAAAALVVIAQADGETATLAVIVAPQTDQSKSGFITGPLGYGVAFAALSAGGGRPRGQWRAASVIDALPKGPGMKILHILKSINPAEGGVVEAVTRMCGILTAQGWKYELVTLDKPDESWVKNSALCVHAMGVRSPVYAWLSRKIPWMRYGPTPHLVPWLRDNVDRFDCIIINGLWNFSVLAARITLVGGKNRYIVFTHGMLDPWFREAFPLKIHAKQLSWWLVEGPLTRNAAFVCFITEEERILAKNAFWPYRLSERVVGNGTIPLAIAAEEQQTAFSKAFPRLVGKRFLLFMSRIHPKKGCDILLRAFAETLHLNPGLELVMAGPDEIGWLSELDQLAKKLSIGHRVHWLGMVSGAAKWGAYHACDAFVLPSHSENFGIAIAEAMACGKPILTTDKVNIWREVKASGGGLIEPDTPAGVAKLLEVFYSLSAEERQAMASAARRGYEQYFDLSKIAVKFRELVENELGDECRSVSGSESARTVRL